MEFGDKLECVVGPLAGRSVASRVSEICYGMHRRCTASGVNVRHQEPSNLQDLGHWPISGPVEPVARSTMLLKKLVKTLEPKDWDPSIKALVQFPDVLENNERQARLDAEDRRRFPRATG